MPANGISPMISQVAQVRSTTATYGYQKWQFSANSHFL
jgi:hypothetical protein